MGGISDVFSGGPSAPSAPDPEEIIDKQYQYNRLNQSGPFGSVSYTKPQNGGNGSLSVNLSPEQQSILDSRQQAQMNLGEQLQGVIDGLDLGPVDTEGFQGIPDTEAARSEAQDAVFGRAQSMLEPQFNRQFDRLEQRLADRGLPPGSEAFNSTLDQFNDDRNQAYEGAAYRAVGAGNDAASQSLRDALATRGQQFNEAATQQQIPINQAQTLLGNLQVQSPQQRNYQTLDVTGPYQINQQAQNYAYGQQSQTYRGKLKGMSDIAGSAIAAGGGG